MSALDETVQPDEGQGEPVTSDAPYAEYLNRIPEELRAQVEPIFKEWDGNTTRKFQEASEYRKQWEPYEQVGVGRTTPEAVDWALQFYRALENPQAIQQWYDAYAQENGLTQQQAAEQQQQAPPADQTFADYQDPSITQALERSLQQHMSPIQQQLEKLSNWQQQQELQGREQAAMRVIEGQLSELQTKHGDEFNREWVDKFVANYIESDPHNAVHRAWDDYQNMVNQISKSALQSKVDAPAPAESGGVPNVAPEEIKTMAQAAEQARNIMRATIAANNT
jgi:hypothetical protein